MQLTKSYKQVMDVAGTVTSPEYNTAKSQLNTTIGRIRTFLGDQSAWSLQWYDWILQSLQLGSMNRLDINKLDK